MFENTPHLFPCGGWCVERFKRGKGADGRADGNEDVATRGDKAAERPAVRVPVFPSPLFYAERFW